VVPNTRGAAVLAADACGDAGLQVAGLARDTQRTLRDMLGREALVAGPVDTTVLVTPGRFRECLELVGADPGVDAVLALTSTTAGSDLVPEVGAARLPCPNPLPTRRPGLECRAGLIRRRGGGLDLAGRSGEPISVPRTYQ
jgi:hypothetical protein